MNAVKVLLALWALTNLLRAAERPADLLFKVTFDEAFSSHAVYAKGDPRSSLSSDLGLRGQEGIVKNALLLEPGERCTYNAKENFEPHQGTVSFWIKPINWDGRTIGALNLFRFALPKSTFGLTISKGTGTQSLMALLEPEGMSEKNQGEKKTSISLKAAVDWRKGQWQKVDVTWTETSLAIYVDGRLIRQLTFSAIKMPARLAAGTLELLPGKNSLRAALDEIEIFNQPHDPSRVLRRYREVMGDKAGEDLPPARLVFLPKVAESKLGILAEFNDLQAKARWQTQAASTQVEITVAPTNGPATTHRFAHFTNDAPYWISQKLSDGQNAIALKLSDSAGGEALLVRGTLNKPPMPWLGARVGVSEDVLAPWSPLAYENNGRTVRCWGRAYTFDGPFLKAVENQSHPLFRSPMRLEIETQAGQSVFEETARQTIKHAPNRAEFSGTGRFPGTAGEVRWESWMEYDGLVVARFTLVPPPAGWDVKSLRLRASLEAGLMRYERGRQVLPAARRIEGTAYGIPDFPEHLWFCNEQEGFLYFCDSEANWVYEVGADLVKVDAKKDPGFELRFISKPTRVNFPITYEVGFQATPVKPMFPGWRAHRFGGASRYPNPTDGVYFKTGETYPGLWLAQPPDTLKKMLERVSKGFHPYLYSYLAAMPDIDPVYQFFGAVWNNPSGATFGPHKLKKTEYYLRPVEPGNPAYVDYLAWIAEQTQREAGPICLYTDGFKHQRPQPGQVNPWSEFLQPDAFGRTVYHHQLLGIRDYAKRVATVLRQHSTPGNHLYWMGHAHSSLVLPYHGFCDWFFPGEEYTIAAQNTHNPYYYMDDLPLEQWRTGFSSTMSGVGHIMLSELIRSGIAARDDVQEKNRGLSDAMLAMCAVHDLNLRVVEHPAAVAEWWTLRDRLGLTNDHARFIGWWQPECPVKTDTPKALASLYRIGDRVVIPVVNRQPKPTEVRLQLNLAALGITPSRASAKDERAAKDLEIKDGHLSVALPARNYTYLSIISPPAQ